MSDIRKNYFFRLIGRIIIFLLCFIIYFTNNKSFEIIYGMNFFESFSVFHILWIIWFVDIFLQIIPVKNKIPLGSQKHFLNRFRPFKEKINPKALKKYISSTTYLAYKVFMK